MKSSCGSSGANRCQPTDLAGNWRSLLLIWGVPFALFAAGFLASSWIRATLWAGPLLVAGVACLVNARRCGRLHCYFTGPAFIAGALVVILAQVGIIPLGPSRWGMLGLGILLVGVVLYVVPEYLCGRYACRDESRPDPGHRMP